MSRIVILFIFSFLLQLCTFSQEAIQNNAYQAGESLKYRVFYNSFLGEVDAGVAVINVMKNELDGRPVYHVIGTGETNRFVDMFYKVRDRFESNIDTATLLPYSFLRRTREGDFVFDDDVSFKRVENIAESRRMEKPVPEDVHDIVSAVFFMRTLSIDDFGEDSLYYLNFYLDDSVYNSVITFEGRGIVETDWGWLPCLKVKPQLVMGEVFSKKYPMSVWVTDDENHLPVLAESEIVVGSVRMELLDFDGLRNPFIEPLSKKERKNYK